MALLAHRGARSRLLRPEPGEQQRGALAAADEARALARALGGVGGLAIVDGGRLVEIERAGLPDSVTLGRAVETASPEAFGQVVSSGEIFVSLSDTFAPDVIVIDVPGRTHVDAPILVVHWCDPAAATGTEGGALFPRTVVQVGDGSTVGVIEVLIGGRRPGVGWSCR